MNILRHKKGNKRKRGFTLIETMVAITVLTFALTGPMMLAKRSLQVPADARLQLTATYLANEGIEVLHGAQDNNSAQDTSTDRNAWLDGDDAGTPVSGGINIVSACLASTASPNNKCVLDVTQVSGGKFASGVLVNCPAGSCVVGGFDRSVIYQNTTSKFYSQFATDPGPSWKKTGFTRTIQVVGVDNVDTPVRQVRVTSIVQFRGIAGMRTIQNVEDFYNWFPKLTP